jgi:cyclopropane fatty-acyl-phospholipid synthase-like methyltransferase
MDRETAFWNKLADKYSRRPVADEAAYKKKLEVTRKYFEPNMEVLEIGCGTGSTAIAHAPFVRHIRATASAHRPGRTVPAVDPPCDGFFSCRVEGQSRERRI